MGRGAGACLAALLRRGATRRRKPEGHAGAHAALLRPGDIAVRAARRAHAGGGARQFAARADHGAGETFAEANSRARARDRRAGNLSVECRRHGCLEARSGVSAAVEIISLDAPVADSALEQLADVLADCVEGGASVSFMSPFSR